MQEFEAVINASTDILKQVTESVSSGEPSTASVNTINFTGSEIEPSHQNVRVMDPEMDSDLPPDVNNIFSAEKLLQKLGVGGLDNIAKTEEEKKILIDKLIEIQVSDLCSFLPMLYYRAIGIQTSAFSPYLR